MNLRRSTAGIDFAGWVIGPAVSCVAKLGSDPVRGPNVVVDKFRAVRDLANI